MSPRGKEKRRGRQARQRGGPRHRRSGARLRWVALFALVAAGVVVASLAGFLVLRGGSGGEMGPPRAVIVDHLSLTVPNPDFVQNATEMLERAGYVVDYYPGEEVTVQSYRDLGTQGYDLIVLRVHAARLWTRERTPLDEVALFTAEPYSRDRYVDEVQEKSLINVRYSVDAQQRYFGIMPGFVKSKMRGTLEGATVILMGCDGLRSQATAKAFVGRGAKAFISWDKEVSADHTDEATERLLHYLLVEDLTPSEAVARAMADVGPDPSYGSKLVLYPTQAAASGAP